MLVLLNTNNFKSNKELRVKKLNLWTSLQRCLQCQEYWVVKQILNSLNSSSKLPSNPLQCPNMKSLSYKLSRRSNKNLNSSTSSINRMRCHKIFCYLKTVLVKGHTRSSCGKTLSIYTCSRSCWLCAILKILELSPMPASLWTLEA